ncbi:protein bride of sevenless [Tribolium madens]|uniref:protein bride of sevenless n=1 Tax=Tribolium madens TaxID=41895 RepID=UPI001CF75DE0|nr:protein bride of sevenless [Tribolium madens]
MSSFYFILVILTNLCVTQSDVSVKEVFRREGDVNVALILHNDCNSTTVLTEQEQSLVNSAIWTVHQLNYSELISFGMSIYKTCNEKEEYQTIFELFQKQDENFLLGLISTSLKPHIRKLCDALDLVVQPTVKCPTPLVKASIELLERLNWIENVTVIASNEFTVNEFSIMSQKKWICITDFVTYKSFIPLRNYTNEYLVIFAKQKVFKTFVENSNMSNVIFVPEDDFFPNDVPENSYVISSKSYNFEQNVYTPNPQLFEVAIPLVNYAQKLNNLMAENCNETNYKQCFKTNYCTVPQKLPEPSEIVKMLKIEPSSINYFIYKAENLTLNKMFVYNAFKNNLTVLEPDYANQSSMLSCLSVKHGCQKQCKNFQNQIKLVSSNCEIRIRTDSWIFAFLSLSLLGVLFCIAILIFLLVSVCRRNVLEGNPVQTLLLLITLMLMYCSILSLSLEGNKSAKHAICMARALSITLSFASAFSLLLSRSIVLATASKEIGFMSHIAGPVQSFLCLFIFGVQAALSLQIINHCEDIFRGHSFVYLLSYNIILLLLLLCFCPLIFKCQRNYREGKYFTFATIIISLLWCLWIPAYIFLGDYYQDSVLCFGLVSTASVLLATIFIPRTYLMTIAAARDKITSTLPSLASATSAMDIYRSGAQPVYDCVNVAAINAVRVAAIQHPDLYSCPHLAEDDFNLRCDTPVTDDKVTRF